MARASLQTRFGYRTSLFRCLCRIAFLVAWFNAVRRRVERDLRQAPDHLQIEVAERTQQASLLNLTHDTIFVNRNRDIAQKLSITEETVKVHIKHIMEKLGAADRTQAVAIALRRGVIQP